MMQLRTLFRGGTVVDETRATVDDILVENGIVAARGECADQTAEIVACEGFWVLPGAVDPHVHFSLESGGVSTADTVVSGSRSALAGGVTTVADFAEQQGPLRQALARHRERWQGAVCDWVVHSMITQLDGTVEADLRQLAAAGEIRSVKVFTTYRARGLYLDDDALYRVIEVSAEGDLTVLVHAESDGMVSVLSSRARARGEGAVAIAWSRPVEAEEEAAFRVLTFTRHAGGRVHLVHLSCPQSVRHLAAARAEGAWASGETCPQYLVLDENVLTGAHGHWFATAPPLRTAALADSLWRCLARGDLQIVSTDSCAFSTSAKDSWGGDFTRIPGGVPGIEVSLRVMMGSGVQAGRIGVTDLVRVMSANPARLLGVYPRKGCLNVGSDADIVLLDPDGYAPIDANSLISRAGWSPYEGIAAAMPPARVYLRGRLVASQGRYVGEDTGGLPLTRARPMCPQ